MKKGFLSLVIALCVVISCKEENEVTPIPDVGFVKATIDGVETVYSTLPPNPTDYNYIKPGSINIQFNKNGNTNEYWAINISHAYVALDLKDLPLPFTISGPSFDFTGRTPEVSLLILDPDGAPYGKFIANGSSFQHPFSLTITSVENNIVRGTFEGEGSSTFERGEFAAQLTVQSW